MCHVSQLILLIIQVYESSYRCQAVHDIFAPADPLQTLRNLYAMLTLNDSIKLDSRNKERMHNFYEVLLKRFHRVGGQTGNLSSIERRDRAKQLDFLSG